MPDKLNWDGRTKSRLKKLLAAVAGGGIFTVP
jgi:hypothetical protein